MRTNSASRLLKSLIVNFFQRIGVGITSHTNLENLRSLVENADLRKDLEFIREMKNLDYELALSLLSKSKAQLRQDIFVLCETEFERGDYFVEFGAANGVEYSNTFLLESEYQWTGILCEPAKAWHEDLIRNRPNSILDFSCVWTESSHLLQFYETNLHELSTIEKYWDSDLHQKDRSHNKVYEVETISLNDLLSKHNAPNTIGYLSIDTEGSEYDILRVLDFEKYSFKVISIEHNYRPQREMIQKLLTNNGYTRKFMSLSKFDDWYVKE